jgi:hypothetical protein
VHSGLSRSPLRFDAVLVAPVLAVGPGASREQQQLSQSTAAVVSKSIPSSFYASSISVKYAMLMHIFLNLAFTNLWKHLVAGQYALEDFLLHRLILGAIYLTARITLIQYLFYRFVSIICVPAGFDIPSKETSNNPYGEKNQANPEKKHN